jgi:ADP-ribose pyrophosphatase YjhB (NUDIX family)
MKTEKFAGVYILKDRKIILVQEKHKEAYGLWSLPLGHVENGEDEKDAAIRETFEETGYKVSILDEKSRIEIDNKDFKSTKEFDDKKISLIIYNAKIVDGNLICGEDVTNVEWVSLDNIKDLSLRGDWCRNLLK